MHPKISIVVHCFNRERYIAETLDSVLSQGYPNLELIVVDDGSSDRSWEIIQGYGPRIASAEQLAGSRKTPVPALNAGFARATGEVIAWLNAKNVLMPKSLFAVGKIFDECPEVEWLTGLATLIDDGGIPLKVNVVRKNLYDFLLGRWQFVQQESTFWRRPLWERVGARLDERYPWSFDLGLWVAFFVAGAELYHVSTVLGAYRYNAEGQSVKGRDVFMEHSRRILDDLQAGIPARVRRRVLAYRALGYARALVRRIPDKTYHRTPGLREFRHGLVQFRSDGPNGWRSHTRWAKPFHVPVLSA